MHPEELRVRLTVKRGEAAKLLGVSARTVDRMVEAGTLRKTRGGSPRTSLIVAEELRRLVGGDQ